SADELTELRKSIGEHGILVPIVIWREQIIDGRHRYKVGCELGIDLPYLDITDKCPDEASMRAYVEALNEHRRSRIKPLSNAEKQERVEAALVANPELSDRQIAYTIGISPPTVGKYRAELEARVKIPNFYTRTDSMGRQQQAHKPPKPEPTDEE